MMIGHDILSESAAADCHLDQRKPTAILIYYNIFYSRFRFFFFFGRCIAGLSIGFYIVLFFKTP